MEKVLHKRHTFAKSPRFWTKIDQELESVKKEVLQAVDIVELLTVNQPSDLSSTSNKAYICRTTDKSGFDRMSKDYSNLLNICIRGVDKCFTKIGYINQSV